MRFAPRRSPLQPSASGTVRFEHSGRAVEDKHRTSSYREHKVSLGHSLFTKGLGLAREQPSSTFVVFVPRSNHEIRHNASGCAALPNHCERPSLLIGLHLLLLEPPVGPHRFANSLYESPVTATDLSLMRNVRIASVARHRAVSWFLTFSPCYVPGPERLSVTFMSGAGGKLPIPTQTASRSHRVGPRLPCRD